MNATKRRKRRRIIGPEHQETAGDPNPETGEPADMGELRTAYVVFRDRPGWRLVECRIPHDVMERYEVKRHEPDGLGIVAAKMEGALLHMTAGRR